MDFLHPTVLRFPKKSHRKQILLPSESPELAELMGIVFGDGGISNKWQVVISLNSEADLEYSYYVTSVLSRLFGINVVVTKRPGQNVLTLICSSSNLVDFLVSKGAVRGNKVAQKFDVPDWIEGDPGFRKAFVRGLVDTDGCLYIHKHTISGKEYKNLGFCFSSYSDPLLNSVAAIMHSFGITPHLAGGTKIYLYSYKAVEKYLDIFGTCNPRIARKYEEWTSFQKMVTISN